MIRKYQGKFDEGWDVLRSKKLKRMAEMGIIDPAWASAPRDPKIPQWDSLSKEEKVWYARCMEVYAAQVEVME